VDLGEVLAPRRWDFIVLAAGFAVRGSLLSIAMEELVRKLNPSRFPGMSPFMSAVVGFVVDESFTHPEIAEMTVSESENLVYIRQVGAVGFDGMESLEDLRNNWNRLLDVAGLTSEERREAVKLFNSKVEKVPGTQM